MVNFCYLIGWLNVMQIIIILKLIYKFSITPFKWQFHSLRTVNLGDNDCLTQWLTVEKDGHLGGWQDYTANRNSLYFLFSFAVNLKLINNKAKLIQKEN